MGAITAGLCHLPALEEAAVSDGCATGSTIPASDGTDCNTLSGRFKKAVITGDAGRVISLLRGRADVNHADNAGLTPLHFAALHGHATVVRELVSADADICAEAWDARRVTPATVAASKGHSDVYRILWAAARLGDTSSSETSDSDSDGSLEYYSCAGSCARDRGIRAVAERRMTYELRQRGLCRHLHAPEIFVMRKAAAAELSYVVVPGLLSPAEIDKVHCAGRLRTARLCADRAADLGYDHVAYRFESELRSGARHLYRRLLGVMVWADMLLWRSLSSYAKVFPEFEYIRYDGAPTSREFAIDPHVDNRSLVTLVCMLSHRADFEGGVLGFKAGHEDDAEEDRSEEPQAGSAIIFRGEMLEHWVSPVTSGTRYVLQIELSSV